MKKYLISVVEDYEDSINEGYVNSEEEAKEICEKLNIKYGYDVNGPRYAYEEIKLLNISEI